MGDQHANNTCRVLALDGGGAKGFYTLGALKEIEGIIGSPISDRFDLIYGTSSLCKRPLLAGARQLVGVLAYFELQDLHSRAQKLLGELNVHPLSHNWTSLGFARSMSPTCSSPARRGSSSKWA